jgi:hypothetical protein
MKKLNTFLTVLVCVNTYAQVCFDPATNFAVDNSPHSVCVADFNGDSKVDLATTNYNLGSVSILLETGSGSFGIANTFSAGASSHSCVSADFNGDGKADLAIPGYSTDTVVILLGSGTGSFGVPIKFAVGTNPTSVVCSDFNGDGKIDLAVANETSSNVSILFGTGTGSFGSATNFSVGAYPQSVISTDFNGDGKIDLATANANNNTVSVLLGTGTGIFGAPTNFTIGSQPASITSADFNGDGHTDLAASNVGSSDISVLLGSGTGTFSAAVNFNVSGYPFSIVNSDFNGDGKIDLATADGSNNTVSILLGTGTGSFSSPVSFSVGNYDMFVVSADFNGDTKPDLVTANYNSANVSVLLSSTLSININTGNIICPGNIAILTASGASTYTWSANAGSALTNTVSVSPTINTSYTVTGSNGACTISHIDTVKVVAPVMPYICMVTTDSSSAYNYNIIYWDKTAYNNVDSFIIYRKISSTYLQVGAVSKSSQSKFIDTAFSIGGPNSGNPQYSSWLYKLAIRDTCGNIGAQSPYHQTMFVQESGANFSWNAYTVETGQTNPITGYSFLRDDNNIGNWHILVNTTSTASTDPNYTSYPNGNWRIDAIGFNCSTLLKSHSNTSKQAPVGIKQFLNYNNKIIIYPNPTSDQFFIETNTTDKLTMDLYDVNGRHVFSASVSDKSNINVTTLNEGIYTMTVKSVDRVINKKLVIVR